jgi:hypothetical protein
MHILLGHLPAHHVEVDGILVDVWVANYEGHLDCLDQAWDVGDLTVGLLVRPGEQLMHLRGRHHHNGLAHPGGGKRIWSTEVLGELGIALICKCPHRDDGRRDGSTPGEQATRSDTDGVKLGPQRTLLGVAAQNSRSNALEQKEA